MTVSFSTLSTLKCLPWRTDKMMQWCTPKRATKQ
ncbi:hypothetical protein [Caudoviricetes sp.]|nr:hypothetical protein [Caudoviricetes sp.]